MFSYPEIPMNEIGPNILFVSYLSGIGGGEQFLYNLIIKLRKAGINCTVLLTSTGLLENRFKTNQIHTIITEFSNKKNLSTIFMIPLVILTICKIIIKHKIDIIHVNDVEFGKFASIAAFLLGKPVLWTSHGWWYSGILREIFYNCFFKRVVFVSEAVKKKYKYLGAKSKCSVIHLGVDTSRFLRSNVFELRKELCLPEGFIYISMVGRYQTIKRHDLFLSAARIVLKDTSNVKFVIVGANVFGVPEDEMNRISIIERVSSDEQLRNSVIFMDFMDKIENVYSISDIVVSSSDFETFGMVHIEAMSCQCAVVSTNCGGPAEIIQNHTNGILVRTNDAEEIAKAINYLILNESDRKRISIAARKRINENFSSGVMSLKYLDLYREIIK